MLSIAKVRRHRLDYYLGQTRAGGAIDGLIEADGVFFGELSDSLGLLGKAVTPAALAAVCEGVDPNTGEVLDPRHHRVRNVAFDCTFAAPKSVSIAHALCEEAMSVEVRAAHEASVREAVSYLEQSAARTWQRRPLPECVVAPGAVVAAGFLHRTSRSLDPHLHTHVLVVNLMRREDEHYVALDARGLYEQLRAGGSLYRAHLRYELTARLGVSWTDSARGFGDLVGLPPKTLRAFSTRTRDIEEELERLGRSGRTAADYVAHATRPAKTTTVAYQQLRDEWRERAFSLGVARSRLGQLVARGGAEDMASFSPRAAAQRVAQDLDRPFDRSELIARTASAARSGSPAPAVVHEVDEVLHDSTVVTAEALRSAYFGAAGLSFPSGPPRTRYLSHAARRRAEELEVRLAAAQPFDRSSSVGDHLSGRYIAAVPITERDPVAELARSLAESPLGERRSVVVLAAHETRAAHLESLCGVPTVSIVEQATIPRSSVVVVDETNRFRTTELSAFDDAAERHRAVVYLLTRRDSGSEHLPSPPMSLDRVDTPPRRESSGDVRVLLCASSRQALATLRAFAAKAHGNDRPTAFVCAEPAFLAAAGIEAVRPAATARMRRAEPETEFVVLGSARVLGNSIVSLRDDRRTHVVVTPQPSQALSRQALVAGIAEPQYLRQAIGKRPSDLVERDRWFAALARIDLVVLQVGDRELSTAKTRRVPNELVLGR